MILDDLAAYARERIREAEKTTPLDVLRCPSRSTRTSPSRLLSHAAR